MSINDIRRSIAMIARYELVEIKTGLSAIRIAAAWGSLTVEMAAVFSHLEKGKEKLEAIIADADEVAE
ncbi:hypothetical protein I7F96_32230 [Sinorhizobium meliloti]|uniref:hypothetical protein n=1 Tax=Rhizobium meliloti TaxID=382 RepID=UPI0023802302|nr:hypothetical protein [Sinorhizobium meliloti]MDE3775432.1 hypothetical protein [Sinorhizobium meliloti]